MKAIKILLILVSTFVVFSSASQAQSKQEQEDSGDKKETTEDAKPDDLEDTNDVLFDEEQEEENATRTKSFTLDANDAVLEEKVVETEHLIEQEDQVIEKTYHYSSLDRNDEIQTLAGKNSHHGGFGAISFRASEFNNQDIILAGFRAGWIINRAFGIGFEGYGIIPTAEYENIDPSNPVISRSVGGDGGLFLEPIILSNKLVHVTFPVSGGAGWLGYIVDWEQNNHYYSNDLIDDDVFWYVEPGAAMELNVARNFRLNMGASYRFTKDLELINTSHSAFDAWNYFLTLKFGSF